MLALSAFVLVACTVATAFQRDEYQVELTTHANQTCLPSQTPCGLGCCPFSDGVCCLDGFECCRHGQTCIPVLGICLNTVNDKPNGLSLVSSKSTPVENLITACPPGTTQCGVGKCCLFPKAVCCSDGLHCCPHGYRCDVQHRVCIKGSLNDIIPPLSKSTYIPAAKVIKKSSYKSCPGSSKICPSNSSCCIADDGQWSCCPNSTSLSHQNNVGNCCTTFSGPTCCPYVCTVFGCLT